MNTPLRHGNIFKLEGGSAERDIFTVDKDSKYDHVYSHQPAHTFQKGYVAAHSSRGSCYQVKLLFNYVNDSAKFSFDA